MGVAEGTVKSRAYRARQLIAGGVAAARAGAGRRWPMTGPHGVAGGDEYPQERAPGLR